MIEMTVVHGFVSTHSRPKAAGLRACHLVFHEPVSTHSRPKAAGPYRLAHCPVGKLVSTHSRPKAAGPVTAGAGGEIHVSTHSRPKAAGCENKRANQSPDGFNTQPPEGGWKIQRQDFPEFAVFQHTAARRRLAPPASIKKRRRFQHTAARRRLAGTLLKEIDLEQFQHTAARRRLDITQLCARIVDLVSTHSRPKAAGFPCTVGLRSHQVSTHSRPKAAGRKLKMTHPAKTFQHTAARRRLGYKDGA